LQIVIIQFLETYFKLFSKYETKSDIFWQI
jgi:hypothetical protein